MSINQNHLSICYMNNVIIRHPQAKYNFLKRITQLAFRYNSVITLI